MMISHVIEFPWKLSHDLIRSLSWVVQTLGTPDVLFVELSTEGI